MDYIRHLSRDPRMRELILQQGPVRLRRRNNPCLRLVESIMSQQLSTRVADVIYARFIDLFDGMEPDAESMLNIKTEQLRSIGLSNAKAAYVHHVARFALKQGMDYKRIKKMDDEEAIRYLTQIKGVGRWTAEMLLMFTFARPDLFALDDLGIQQGMIRLYGLRSRDKKILRKRMEKISSAWRPYRTYACLHLWKFKDQG